jgi:hypothetical protein
MGGSVWVNPKPSVPPQRVVVCPPNRSPPADCYLYLPRPRPPAGGGAFRNDGLKNDGSKKIIFFLIFLFYYFFPLYPS